MSALARCQCRHWGGGAPGDTIQGGVTLELNYFLWLNLERTLDQRRRKVGFAMRRQL